MLNVSYAPQCFAAGGGEVQIKGQALLAGLLLALYCCRMLMVRVSDETPLREETLCLALLRNMAAAVAHDFNNVLGSMTLFSQMLRGTRLEAEGEAYVDNLLISCRLGQNFTANLQVFAGVWTYKPQKCSIAKVVAALTPILRLLMPDLIDVRFADIDRDLTVLGDPFLMEQALIDLALNSRDAMADGGTLRFDCKRRDTLSDGEGNAAQSPAGTYAVLSVEDTGKGIDPAVVDKVFDPLFTTKNSKGRIGLGLPVVRRIMEMHGGRVELRSSPGRGTIVDLYFRVV